MNRRSILKVMGSLLSLTLLPPRLLADMVLRRRRPTEPGWPLEPAWNRLRQTVDGKLMAVGFPLTVLEEDPGGDAAKSLEKNIRNPYFVGDHPGLTETLGWVDAWVSRPSVYAVAAESPEHIAAAVDFARDNDIRLVVKGGGHSYQGTSNAPDSLLVWTRHMHDIELDDKFVPQGCDGQMQPQPAVTMGAGTVWMQAYRAVTTEGGRYVQGGGCTTVGVAGLVQSGGFGSFSKHYGTAASSLLEAEIVTADGHIRIANACTNPDLFWALKGGGGGTFGVVSKLTLRTHALPDYFGTANFTINASSDASYRRLIESFVDFYADHLFNDHWGEQVHVRPDNRLAIRMMSWGLAASQMKAIWKPFLDWVEHTSGVSVEGRVVLGSLPARHMWDPDWLGAHWPELAFPPEGSRLTAWFDTALAHVMHEPVYQPDDRPGAPPGNFWWDGDGGQVCWFIWGYESCWLPASLLSSDHRRGLAAALFAASRDASVELHCNKGIAGAPAEAIAATKDTATNPVVADAFALAIVANGQGPAYPGIAGHEPSVAEGRKAAQRIRVCMNKLRRIAGNTGSYLAESNYFEKDWQQSYWGDNYARLAAIKQKYDPDGLFYVHNGVGSEAWRDNGFTKV